LLIPGCARAGDFVYRTPSRKMWAEGTSSPNKVYSSGIEIQLVLYYNYPAVIRTPTLNTKNLWSTH